MKAAQGQHGRQFPLHSLMGPVLTHSSVPLDLEGLSFNLGQTHSSLPTALSRGALPGQRTAPKPWLSCHPMALIGF